MSVETPAPPAVAAAANPAAANALPATPGREGTIPAWFEEQVRRSPDAVALTQVGGGLLTYAELDARANRFAHWLRAAGVRPGDTVGLHLSRSTECVAAMLGVLKAAAAYLPLEPHVHHARLVHCVRDAGAAVVVSADPATAANFGVRVLDVADGSVDRQPATAPDLVVRADDTVYVTYTSGSTGTPKGTLVPHRAVPGFFAGTDYAVWGPDSTSLLHCALAWDGHLIDLYPALLTGGRVVVPAHDTGDPLATVRCAAEHGVTVMFLTTAAFNLLAHGDTGDVTAPRHLLFGGEAVSPQHTRQVARRHPGTRLVNCYGPSETTVFSTVRPVREADLADGRIPIGTPVGDRTVRVLDENLRPCPSGVTGELYVSGPALAHGYHHRPGLTARAFVPDPFSPLPGARMYRTGDLVRQLPDGAYEFIGRRDNQAKIRGRRVEPGEIEVTLAAHPDVTACAVTVWEPAAGDKRLAAHLATRDGTPADPAALRAFLADRLPAYLVPATFTTLPALPLTANGKLDRAALPVPHDDAPTAAEDLPPEPADPLRDLIGLTWAKLLGVEQVRGADNFAALGGHSLLAVRLVHVLRAALGVNVTLASLVGSRDLDHFTTAVRATIAAEGAEPDLPGLLERLSR
ncbi:non-ribosomal peptide synthetase [Streptomyces sp. SL13]|uniref:Non-ribosomal peptide synthetase n=1 Tax=Streptantibioticus silvisoli TaxID=2705255 RepID=A0AA90H7K8_9ACTN|nr:non-ribosomal peptide synthetase [Streptantibioticus silvisoli]MDI5972676.1 non-ribosomal peptide synthetase [Streptantibioticus silvisoli]